MKIIVDLMAIFSRKHLPRMKDKAYVIHFNVKNSKGTHWFHYLLIEIQPYTLILL